MPCPSLPSMIFITHTLLLRTVQIMTLHYTVFSSLLLLALWPTHIPQHPILKYPQHKFIPWCKSNPITGLNRPRRFQEVEAPKFQGNQHMKVVRLSALYTGCPYPQEIFLVLISVRGWVNLRTTVWPEGLCQWSIPMKPLEMEPVAFQLVAQCFNQLRQRTSLIPWCKEANYYTYMKQLAKLWFCTF
jgi:hypothetical protein